MKRKLLLCAAILAVIAVVVAAGIDVNRSAGFFRDATVLDATQLEEFMPNPDYLIYAAQYETDDFFVELLAFRDEEQRIILDHAVDGVRFLWRIEPRGNTRLHRYDFQLWQPDGLVWETSANTNHMFVRYGDRVVEKPAWSGIIVGTAPFPARFWRGFMPTGAQADEVWIWAEAFVPIMSWSIENMLLSATLTAHRRNTNREALDVTFEWAVLPSHERSAA